VSCADFVGATCVRTNNNLLFCDAGQLSQAPLTVYDGVPCDAELIFAGATGCIGKSAICCATTLDVPLDSQTSSLNAVYGTTGPLAPPAPFSFFWRMPTGGTVAQVTFAPVDARCLTHLSIFAVQASTGGTLFVMLNYGEGIEIPFATFGSYDWHTIPIPPALRVSSLVIAVGVILTDVDVTSFAFAALRLHSEIDCQAKLLHCDPLTKQLAEVPLFETEQTIPTDAPVVFCGPQGLSTGFLPPPACEDFAGATCVPSDGNLLFCDAGQLSQAPLTLYDGVPCDAELIFAGATGCIGKSAICCATTLDVPLNTGVAFNATFTNAAGPLAPPAPFSFYWAMHNAIVPVSSVTFPAVDARCLTHLSIFAILTTDFAVQARFNNNPFPIPIATSGSYDWHTIVIPPAFRVASLTVVIQLLGFDSANFTVFGFAALRLHSEIDCKAKLLHCDPSTNQLAQVPLFETKQTIPTNEPVLFCGAQGLSTGFLPPAPPAPWYEVVCNGTFLQDGCAIITIADIPIIAGKTYKLKLCLWTTVATSFTLLRTNPAYTQLCAPLTTSPVTSAEFLALLPSVTPGMGDLGSITVNIVTPKQNATVNFIACVQPETPVPCTTMVSILPTLRDSELLTATLLLGTTVLASTLLNIQVGDVLLVGFVVGTPLNQAPTITWQQGGGQIALVNSLSLNNRVFFYWSQGPFINGTVIVRIQTNQTIAPTTRLVGAIVSTWSNVTTVTAGVPASNTSNNVMMISSGQQSMPTCGVLVDFVDIFKTTGAINNIDPVTAGQTSIAQGYSPTLEAFYFGSSYTVYNSTSWQWQQLGSAIVLPLILNN